MQGGSRSGPGMTSRAGNGSAVAVGGTDKKKGPLEVFLKGPVNPAATYSPGPGGQVPSAIWGLTSVFGMGTGVTPTR